MDEILKNYNEECLEIFDRASYKNRELTSTGVQRIRKAEKVLLKGRI